jgi:phenylacetate-CoA ligase
MKMNERQLSLITEEVGRLSKLPGGFYEKKYEGIDCSKVKTQKDFEELPFTTKADLRNAYPLGLQAVPEEEIVRIHSSSGTTGTPVIIPYTKKDVDDWSIQFARCYEMAGITKMDRIQITPGYGLWTAGIGFQLGAEYLGAMTIPLGPGNTDKQLQMMQDLKSTVITATSSYALLLTEEIEKRGLKDKICLKKGVIGSERWGEKMRQRIKNGLGIQIYDIYGLTEIYGPGIGISCDYEEGMHYWDDYVYIEIVDPATGRTVPDGEQGEIVITTLVKQGAPLIRYNTHDISRIIPEPCRCGSKYPRIDTIVGRSDDMFKVKGVNMFPKQIDDVLSEIDGVSSEYQLIIDHIQGKDEAFLSVEVDDNLDYEIVAKQINETLKSRIGLHMKVNPVPTGSLPRSEKKTKRIFDRRFQ